MGAALATVEVQHHSAQAPRKVRISAKVKAAIDLMVHTGQRRADAAKAAGLVDESLRQALNRPECRAYRLEQMQVIRESAASRTIAKAEKLMDSAESEHVQADMTKWLAGLEGISVTQRTESNINFSGGPGLVIVMQAAPERGQLIDGQPHEVGYVSREKHLSPPVPHPSRGTPARKPEISGDSGRPEGEGEG